MDEFYGYYINEKGQVLDWKGEIHNPKVYKGKQYSAVPINILNNDHTKRVATVYRYVHVLVRRYIYNDKNLTTVIDHINQNKEDFRECNMRRISTSKNAKNRTYNFTIVMMQQGIIKHEFHNYVNATDILGINDEAPEYYEFRTNIKKVKDSGNPLIIGDWDIYMYAT